MKCPNCSTELKILDTKLKVLEDLLESHRNALGISSGQSCIGSIRDLIQSNKDLKEELEYLKANSRIIKRSSAKLPQDEKARLNEILNTYKIYYDVRDNAKRRVSKGLKLIDELSDPDAHFLMSLHKKLSKPSGSSEE